MEFRIGALAQDRAGVKHLVARLEQRDLGAYRVHYAGRVVTEDLGVTSGGCGALADLGVHRVDRHGFHGHPDVARLRFRFCRFDVAKRFGLLYIDCVTQARIPKASAYWYRDLIQAHRFSGAGGYQR